MPIRPYKSIEQTQAMYIIFLVNVLYSRRAQNLRKYLDNLALNACFVSVAVLVLCELVWDLKQTCKYEAMT